MSNALDEILLKHGADKGELQFSLKQAFYQLILAEVIGEDYKGLRGVYSSTDAKDDLRAEQRQTLAKLFNQESDDE